MRGNDDSVALSEDMGIPSYLEGWDGLGDHREYRGGTVTGGYIRNWIMGVHAE